MASGMASDEAKGPRQPWYDHIRPTKYQPAWYTNAKLLIGDKVGRLLVIVVTKLSILVYVWW